MTTPPLHPAPLHPVPAPLHPVPAPAHTPDMTPPSHPLQSIWESEGMEVAKSFLRALLQPDPSLRPSAREALQLPWLAGSGAIGAEGSAPAQSAPVHCAIMGQAAGGAAAGVVGGAVAGGAAAGGSKEDAHSC